MSLFITGTDTGVGKTVITAGLAAAIRRSGQSVCVYKPIQTGSEAHSPEDPTQIQTWLGDGIHTSCSYCFSEPVAPYAADPARTIRSQQLLNDFQSLRKKHQHLLVEGAGGVRVPITPNFEMLDLARMLQLPVLVVARPFLGTINHTLLTVDALLRERLEVKGVVISGLPDNGSDSSVHTLHNTLDAFLPVPILATIPQFDLSAAGFQNISIQNHFDQLLAAL